MPIKRALIKIDNYFDDERSWCQGTMWRNSSGMPTQKVFAKRCCLLGAISLVITDSISVKTDCLIILARVINPYGVNPSEVIMKFNDDPGRTFSDIKKVIKLAIEKVG